VTIRPERTPDAPAIRAVNLAAFETTTEADLVDLLRTQASPVISLVAEDGPAICGHIMFSPVTLGDRGDVRIAGLAPMAVLPSQQRRGIGTALVLAGLEACARIDYGAVVVLGHAGYYPRFGFRPASGFGLRSEYDVPDEAFMALELRPGSLAGAAGVIRYHPTFAQV
jgi:putative acetyltransferase